MKLLRTIRFDGSDERIFERAARSGEWAVPAAFAFAQMPRDKITGKMRQAFANGFLGLASFGWSTFVIVAEARRQDLAWIEQQLAAHFMARYGAPDLAAAMPAAIEEAAFATDLCKDAPINTVFMLRRFFDERGEIREEIRKITPPAGAPMHTRIWTVVEDEP